MNKFLILLLPFLFLCKSSLAQKDTIFFNEHGDPVQSKEEAIHYELKPVKLNKHQFEIKTYYISNNSLYLKGISKDKRGDVPHGYAIYYYENGNKKSEGNYANGKENGLWISYYENGRKESEGHQYKGYKNGIWKFYYEDSDKLYSLENYKNSYYNGEMTAYYKNGKIRRYEIYKNGEFISGNCYTPTGQDTSYYPDRSQIRFPGGNELYEDYVFKHTKLRGYWKKHKLKGSIYIHAYFDEKGKIYKAFFEERKDPVADEEAMRIIMNMPNWEPAEDETGKPVKSDRSLDIWF